MRRTTRFRPFPAAGMVLAFLMTTSACSDDESDAASAPAATNAAATSDAAQPVMTSEADWAAVAEALGRPGKLSGGTVYRVGFPRSDLKVTSQGVAIQPGFALGSYAAFARYPDNHVLVMGDLVVTEPELQKVTQALQDAGVAQTAVHKHLLTQTPAVWWTHYEQMSTDAVALARNIPAALDKTATPPATAPEPAPAPDLDTAGIDAAMGSKGTADGGIYKFTYARAEAVAMEGMTLPPAMGVTTAINFQPTGQGKAAINGDFVMTAEEVQPVIRALRAGGIDIVEVHQHMLSESPRLFFMHFWAVDDAVALAKTLATAVAATASTPA